MITTDEVIYAGGAVGVKNIVFYLSGVNFWTLSPIYFVSTEVVLCVQSYGNLSNSSVINQTGVRPVINLRADVAITGSGTGDDPFVVN